MSRRTRIKICGITRLEDAEHATLLGADAIGLVFHPPSPRALELEQAVAIRRAIPPFVTVAALFLDDAEDWIGEVLVRVRPDCIQFHGSEEPVFCRAWDLPFIKAIPMASTADASAYARRYAGAQGFLLDSNAAGLLGGSGDTFDWSRIPSSFEFPLVLAGGINASNVADAIARIGPWAVDVSTGVETSKGIKSSALMDRLFDEVKRADSRQ